ncbi:MAG TPA: hypothetical protein VFH31_20145, partial [Pyrinomonadaceae bacterium]|nr:hypothetical protein [Pyrinomonadaceae bacterium]
MKENARTIFRFRGKVNKFVLLNNVKPVLCRHEVFTYLPPCTIFARTLQITRLVSMWINFGLALGALVIIVLFGASVSHAQILVTAVRDGSGNLKLISWNENGTRLNGDDAQAGGVSNISAVRLGNSNQMVTAVRDAAGNLKVIVWRVFSNGRIVRRESAQAGVADLIAVASNPTGDRLTTAVRIGDSTLRVILWAITREGGVIRLGHGPIVHGQPERALNAVSATFVGPSGTLLATAMGDFRRNLKITTWRITKFGCVTKLH